MTAFSLEGQIDCTADHNDIVPVLLGLSKILDDIAERVKVEEGDGRSDRQSEASEPIDEDLVLAVLGLLSVRRTLRRWLSQCPPVPLTPDDGHIDREKLETNLRR
jgi:hypothetical protein